ncbi:hypothetical protein FI667_g2563, partial [Globisporangium splendens]
MSMDAFTLESLKAKLRDHPYEIIYLNDSGSSWIIHAKRFATVESFDACWALHPAAKRSILIWGRPVALPRFVENYGVDYKFSGSLFRGQEMPEVMRPAIERLQSLVVDKAGETMLNNCSTNWYETGENYIGPHCDNERELYATSPVLTLSLGATRSVLGQTW